MAKIIVEPASDLTEGLRITEENVDGDARLRVQHPAVIPPFTIDARQKYRDGLMMLISQFIVHIAVVEDIASYMDRVAGESEAFSSATLLRDFVSPR